MSKIYHKALRYYKLYKWSIAKKFLKTLTIQCEYFKLKVPTQDEVIAPNFYFFGAYGLEELEKSIQFLKASNLYTEGNFLDIGANIGFMSLYSLSKKYHDNAICIEPDKVNFSILKANMKINNFQNQFSAYNTALASSTGKGKLILSKDNFGDHRIFTGNEVSEIDKYNNKERSIIDIAMITLDELSATNSSFDNVSFICMDVQGYEIEIIKGGTLFFSKGIPMLMEIDSYLLEKKGSNSIEIHSELRKYYTKFIDITDNQIEYRMEEFMLFYDNLKRSGIQHKDILLIRN